MSFTKIQIITSCIYINVIKHKLHFHCSPFHYNAICITAAVMDSSPGELSEKLVMQEKRKKGRRTNCDIGEAMEGLENEL